MSVLAPRPHRSHRIARRSGAVAAVALSVALLAACSSSSDGTAKGTGGGPKDANVDPAGTVFPGATWAKASPASLDLDGKELDRIAADAKSAGSTCFLVARHGKIAASYAWGGTQADTPAEVFSASKSFSSILVGMAQAEGKLKITDKMSKYIPAWKGTPADAVTIQDILSNDSGRHWDFQTDYFGMTGAHDRNAFAAALNQDAPPGKVWIYNNSAIQLLSPVLKQATGMEAKDYAEKELFGPIGMDQSHMTTDGSGHTSTFMGLQSTCEDLARFGVLMLRHGDWDGKQVVPAAWVKAATGAPSQKLNASYGYLFWLNRKGRMPDDNNQATKPGDVSQRSKVGQKVPGAPADMYWALGLGNQIVQMDPGSDTVVVRIGPGQPPAGSTNFTETNTSQVVTDALTDGGK